MDSQTERALGAYLGLAVGDALGATVEFMTASEIATTHRVHRDIVGGGWLHLKPGQVTDDTQMSLALGRAMIAWGGWSTRAAADAFLKWMLSMPIDIGHTCRRGIRRYMLDGSLCAHPSDDEAGNGAAMRNLPVVIATLHDPVALEQRSLEQVHITHHHPLSDAATVALAHMTRRLILGDSIEACRKIADDLVARHPQFRYAPWPGLTSGYIVDTVQTVLDAVFTSSSVEDAIVRAVNRGGDADTIGALAGQLAGARYGARLIPARWLRRLDPGVFHAIRGQVPALLALSSQRAT
ncbi:MAG: ADP-ribosyl-[dinitrogen reductase] hydrolase [Opitutaceae bacterium]|nr:ADP-ribosyl-[dinitrogen reductase] hydrolase [Opitutaceae bacterium]